MEGEVRTVSPCGRTMTARIMDIGMTWCQFDKLFSFPLQKLKVERFT